MVGTSGSPFPCARTVTMRTQVSFAAEAASSAATAPGSAHTVVLVESPAKARKIQDYLGPSCKVLASYGHIRDLPSKPGSVAPQADFEMRWQLTEGSPPRVAAIAEALQGAQRLVLATDPDREGEAISWHLTQELQARGVLRGVEVQRITFTEVTRAAVTAALAQPRDVAEPLVQAYMARRALDYLVGFSLSPLLWRKLPGARSAGRVQSVALRLVCEREQAIEAFKPAEYWSVEALVQTPTGDVFQAQLTHLGGQKLGKMGLPDAAAAQAAAQQIAAAQLQVDSVSRKATARNPPPPFITSSLQQEASGRLGFGAARTMQLAQQLYEGTDVDGEGVITYMRTDGVQISPDAVAQVRDTVRQQFGDDYVPQEPRIYKSKAKNAQEAHEAIRPTSAARTPSMLPAAIDASQRRLYELILRRTLASQMASASIEQVGVDVTSMDRGIILRATGTKLLFPGFLAAYADPPPADSAEDEEGVAGKDQAGTPKTGDASAVLAALQEGAAVAVQEVTLAQHFTKPPPRFTEGSLVRALEERGIGRPSTYAAILKLLVDRKYVGREGRALKAESLGRVLTGFLETYFKQYVDYDFTSSLEEQLDDVSGGKAEWKEVLRQFWDPFHGTVTATTSISVTQVIDALNDLLAGHFFPPKEDGSDPRRCPGCQEGQLGLKLSRTGGFIGCTAYPTCAYTRPLLLQDVAARDGAGTFAGIEAVLGDDPKTGLPVLLKRGPHGRYIQLGEATNGTKPRRATVYEAGKRERPIQLEQALRFLELPKELGQQDGQPVRLAVGRFGPYLSHADLSVTIPKAVDYLGIDLPQALELLGAKRQRLAARGARDAAEGRPPRPPAKRRKLFVSKAVGSKGPSAYNLWLKESWSGLKAANPSLPLLQLRNLASAEWKSLDPQLLASFQARAAAQRQPPSAAGAVGDSQSGTSAAEAPRKVASKGAAKAGGRVQKPRGKQKIDKGTSGLKRPLNAWMLFCGERRGEIRVKNPKITMAAVTTQLAEEWQGLSEEGRKPYEDAAVAAKLQYAADKADLHLQNGLQPAASSRSNGVTKTDLTSSTAKRPKSSDTQRSSTAGAQATEHMPMAA